MAKMTREEATRIILVMFEDDGMQESMGPWSRRIYDPRGSYATEAELSEQDAEDGLDPTWDARQCQALRIFADLTPDERKEMFVRASQDME